MNESLADILQRYNYEFPRELIAHRPARPRDSARLLAYDCTTHEVRHETFRALPQLLPPGAVLVMNETKVLPARLWLAKPTGGKIECLYISHKDNELQALLSKTVPSGTVLRHASGAAFEVLEKNSSIYTLRYRGKSSLFTVFQKHGVMPLPPYITSTDSKAKVKHDYQTVFAKKLGSVAAPTASLHITNRLMSQLKKQGTDIAFVTLHVGLGTFASLTESNVQSGRLHKEQYVIGAKTAQFLNKAKQQGRPIIAVGTTVVRTLESAAKKGQLTKLSGSTDLFIREGYRFQFVDGIITNFHVPKSSLLMLVSAFAGREEVLALYHEAIQKKYRLFSFGDGMLIT